MLRSMYTTDCKTSFFIQVPLDSGPTSTINHTNIPSILQWCALAGDLQTLLRINAWICFDVVFSKDIKYQSELSTFQDQFTDESGCYSLWEYVNNICIYSINYYTYTWLYMLVMLVLDCIYVAYCIYLPKLHMSNILQPLKAYHGTSCGTCGLFQRSRSKKRQSQKTVP